MFLLTALWQLLLRILFGIVFFFLLIGVAYLFVGNKGPNSRTHKSGKCNYVEVANLSIGVESFSIPAIKGTAIEFPNDPFNPREITYVVTENNRPWDRKTKGFCAGHLEGQPDPELISIERHALQGVASKLGLPSSGTIDRLTFGMTGFNAFMHLEPIIGKPEFPEKLVLRRKAENLGTNWYFLQTAGWMDNGYRLSSFCVYFIEENEKHCSIRLTRRSDGMVFEVWRMAVDKIPTENSPPPAQFLEVIDKLPKIIDYYRP